MKAAQLNAVRCALADLIGSYQAHKQSDRLAHDWEAHWRSIEDLAEAFGLESEVPDPEQEGDGSEDHDTADRNPNRNGFQELT